MALPVVDPAPAVAFLADALVIAAVEVILVVVWALYRIAADRIAGA